MARRKTILDEDLLTAARDCFVERGFTVSTKAIARRAGVSEGLLFQRYGTKADLFFAAMVPPQTGISVQLNQSSVSEDHLVRLGISMIEYFRSAVPVLLPLMSHPAFRFEDFAGDHPEAALVTMRREAVQYFVNLRSPDPPASALLLMSSTFGICMFERLGAHGGKMPEEFVYRMLQRIWMASKP